MMDLLPKHHSDFVKPEYWDGFFKKRGTKAFEWYGEYPELCGTLHKYIKPTDHVLVLGCGNSQLSADLYDVGYHNIVNIDISDTVIKQMIDKNQTQRPKMTFLKMDALNMEFPDGHFSVVLDKGTLDALLVDESEVVLSSIQQMFIEIGRVLKQGGRYICISLLQEHILNQVLQYFPNQGWPVRIVKINTEDSENSDKEFSLPAFAMIFTKFKNIPGMKQILEVSSFEDKIDRCDSVDQLRSMIKEVQYYFVLRRRVNTRKLSDQVSLCLYSPDSSTPRYTLHIVDGIAKTKNRFAVFIVPQGRETEWMFASEAGRIQLSKSAGFERLIVVTLDRDHKYESLNFIKSELSGKILELVPPGFKNGTQVPFLSIGDDIGKRTIQFQGHSEFSGDVVIEDVEGDEGKIFRRLIFLANKNIVQSEALLVKKAQNKKKGKSTSSGALRVDKSYLSCSHHSAMVTGLAMVESDDFKKLIGSSMHVILVGLGGGGLPSFIHQYFPQIHIDVVDIDHTVVTMATDWFEFIPDNKMSIYVQDGIQYIKNEVIKGHQSHVIMLDVDSKDVSVGMSCPPKPFVEIEFLQQIHQSLHPGGVFVLNLVCRNLELKKEIITRIKSLFDPVYVRPIEDEINEVIFAVKKLDTPSLPCNAGDSCNSKDMIKEHVEYLNQSIKRNKCTHIDLEEMFQGLALL
ncbi:hypothetical protein CHS0354_013617 [Potamilus streckersoni]|uniref:Methyltransferase type 11 domain-containing protein n=1 Tax=Potamilus streckersoni TaxID=2493646 RepID=A0AAE0SL53_9BIVA|nr:hypothetical protein CHS0354_013617 [Potamilus streckersoni]